MTAPTAVRVGGTVAVNDRRYGPVRTGSGRGVEDAAPYGETRSRICHCEASAHTGRGNPHPPSPTGGCGWGTGDERCSPLRAGLILNP